MKIFRILNISGLNLVYFDWMEVKIKKAFKFRLELTQEQNERFQQFAGTSRFAYNYALARKKTIYKETRKTITSGEIQKEITHARSRSGVAASLTAASALLPPLEGWVIVQQDHRAVMAEDASYICQKCMKHHASISAEGGVR